MKSQFIKRALYIWLIALATAAIALGKNIYSGTKTADSKYSLYKDFELFADVLSIVQKSYVKEVSPQDLIHGAIYGVMDTLDEHSQFLTSEEYKEIRVETQGEFGGIGVEVTIRNKYLTIVTPMEDTPAFFAGIKPGDKIIKIDGEGTDKLSLDEAIEKLRGDPGTKITLTVMRPHIKELLEFSMERSFIKIQSVKDAQILSGNIGYIRITQFQQNTAEDCKKIFEKLLPQATQGLIIDVRNNPGGLLKEASDCISYFIEAPKLIVSTKGRLSDQNDELRSKNKSAVKDLPLVVLINKGSASGAEILAGAVKDWHRGILVGTNTFGKGSVQTVLPLRDGSALKLTTAEYFTPKGININDIGIKPDIEVQMTEEAEDKLWKFRSTKENKSDAVLDLSIDPQLQRAIDILKGLSVYSEITSNETANKT